MGLTISGSSATVVFVGAKGYSQTATIGATTVITYTTEEFDSHAAFASGVFTVPSGQGGYYSINFRAVANASANCYLRKNSSNYSYHMNSGANTQIVINTYILLAAGDTIDVRSNSAITLDTTGPTSNMEFSIIKVGS